MNSADYACAPGRPFRLVAGPAMLALVLCALTPCMAFAQSVPPVPKPTLAGTWCPACNEYLDCPNGRYPSSCKYCGFSFTQKSKPAPMTPSKPKLQTIDPFGDYLFYDVPLHPEDGKLQTRHLDPNGLAAKAEEWGRNMRQLDEQSRQKQEARAREFERDKQALLKDAGNSASSVSAKPQLRNIYGGDPNVVDLTGKKTGTPQLLRNPFHKGDAEAAAGAPMSGALTEHGQIRNVSEQSRYAHMRPGELDALAAQYPDNPEIQRTISRLKARTQSLDTLAQTSEQVAQAQETMASEQRKGNREAVRATATVLDLTAGIPQGWDEVYYREKSAAQYLGVDVASNQIDDRFQDYAAEKAESYVLRRGLETPGPVKALGGVKGVITGATAVEDLVGLAKSANAAGEHYVNAAELRAQVQAAGGTVGAVGNWSYVRGQALNDSSQLYRLIQEEEARRRAGIATH